MMAKAFALDESKDFVRAALACPTGRAITDVAFAELVSRKLGRPVTTTNHVTSTRRSQPYIF